MPVLMATAEVAKVARALRRLRECEYLPMRGVMIAVAESADDLEDALGLNVPAQRKDNGE